MVVCHILMANKTPLDMLLKVVQYCREINLETFYSASEQQRRLEITPKKKSNVP